MKHRKKKKTTHRRRRVSGINANSPLVMVAGIAAGYFLGPKINGMLTAPVSTTNTSGGPLKSVDPKLLAAGEIALGFFGPRLIKKKNPIVSILGGLMVGAGLHEGLTAFGVVSGIPVISGYKDLRAIAGIDVAGKANQSGTNLNSMQVISGIRNASEAKYAS